MRKSLRVASLLIFSTLVLAQACYAGTVTISPTMPSVALGKTVQFSAKASGFTGVTWSAGGKVGGSSVVGTISSSGLYTAPAAMPAQNSVQITATTNFGVRLSASTSVTLVASAPKITSVSPNPLAQGAITVTIDGTGFTAGATVTDTSGGSSIPLATSSVTATVITAKGNQGAATSASFTVTNPGSAASNSITVPVTGNNQPTKYTLTVVNGTGSGSYTAGTVVNIAANAPAAGKSFSNWTGATVANPNSSATTITMPASNTTVTANYSTIPAYALTVVNGTGSGSYAAGAVVNISANAPPAGQSFTGWTGATVANSTAASTTLTMPASSATVTANYAAQTAGQIPFPVTTHPRLWITQTDLARLQGWANPNNPAWAQGMQPLLAQAVNVYNTYFFPGGVAANPYPDPGDVQGYGILNDPGGPDLTSNSEQWAVVLAFGSLIDPNPSNRITDAQDARNLLMHAMNLAQSGPVTGAPFQDPMFAIYNRANGSGEQWPLIVDWIYNAKNAQGNPILSPSDKATIRKVFLLWASQCEVAVATGGDHPTPVGLTNSLQLLPNDHAYRVASNNYFLGHARFMTMMALSFDPSDDPPVNTAAPATQIGNSLRSYILDANGAWLYQEYAMMGDPSSVANDYGIPGDGAGLGLASGGLPLEGMLYGHSLGFALGQLLALQTAGFNNVAYSGPQIHLIGAPVWDRFVTGYISSLMPTAQVPASAPWLGPVYQFAGYGDMLREYITPDNMEDFALLDLLDHENGVTKHDNASRWFVVNAISGGAGALLSNISAPGAWSTSQSILYYMMLDPAAPAATDPRPTFPTLFFDQPAGRVLAHSDWTPSGTLFDFRASWISINHQNGDGGEFEFFRNGEWLTKEMSNYDSAFLGQTTVYHNTLSLQNWCANGTPNLNWYETGIWANGSEWMEGVDAGDPTTTVSSGPGYVYVSSDLKNLFNRPEIWIPADAAMDITQATRSVMWIDNDYIVVYDRATSVHSGLFKRFNLQLVTNPAISGNTTTETMADGQRLYIQTLLPQNPSVASAYTAGNLNPIAEMEPTQYTLTIQDPTKPSDTRFLHVLQGANPGVAMTGAIHVQSSGGTAFDGAAFGADIVWFPVSSGGSFAGTTLPVPAGAHTVMVTGLAANASYGVSVQGGTVTITAGGTSATTDSAGVLSLSV